MNRREEKVKSIVNEKYLRIAELMQLMNVGNKKE